MPAGAYNVAAQLLAREAGVDPGSTLGPGAPCRRCWVTLRAARVELHARGGADRRDHRADAGHRPHALYGHVLGLTPREAELLGHLATGDDTRALAARLYLSAHTVQDHLKAVFAKAGSTAAAPSSPVPPAPPRPSDV